MDYLKNISGTINFEKKILFLILITSSIILLTAIIIGQLMNAPPCELCIYQRIPYFIIIILVLINFNRNFNLILNIKTICFISSLLFLSSSTIAIYHVGVEKGFFQTSCAPNQPQSFSLEEIQKAIHSPITPSCNNIPIELFGISMAGYNFIASLFCACILLWISSNNNLWKRNAKK
jgi:disulfide bond formation protein DsbB